LETCYQKEAEREKYWSYVCYVLCIIDEHDAHSGKPEGAADLEHNEKPLHIAHVIDYVPEEQEGEAACPDVGRLLLQP